MHVYPHSTSCRCCLTSLVFSQAITHAFSTLITWYKFASKWTWIFYYNCSPTSFTIAIDQTKSNYALTHFSTNFCASHIDATTTYVAFLAHFSSHSFHLSYLILYATTLFNVLLLQDNQIFNKSDNMRLWTIY
jgi:hypothetical protein